ncbi:MAG: hypothetical protein GWP04_05825 [Gammaproteobacteria bacterium]|nr:hypothetical protein [Gammaproteobacteria bacterium]
MAKEYQLRMYDVAEGKMEEFLAIFPAVVEARRSVGFDVVGAWTIPEENKFVWIVSTEAPGGIDALSDAYYASPLRAAIDPEPASLLDEIETRLMQAVPF